MTNYYARVEYTYNGDRIYSIPFSYMKEEEIKIYRNYDKENTLEYTYLNSSQIKILSDLDVNDVIIIERQTDISQKIVDYQNLSMVLDDENLNKSQDQILNAVQEVYDNEKFFEQNINEQWKAELGDLDELLKELVGE